MPYCEVDRYQDGEQWEGVRLFYTRHGRGATKVLLVVGKPDNPNPFPPLPAALSFFSRGCFFFFFGLEMVLYSFL